MILIHVAGVWRFPGESKVWHSVPVDLSTWRLVLPGSVRFPGEEEMAREPGRSSFFLLVFLAAKASLCIWQWLNSRVQSFPKVSCRREVCQIGLLVTLSFLFDRIESGLTSIMAFFWFLYFERLRIRTWTVFASFSHKLTTLEITRWLNACCFFLHC